MKVKVIDFDDKTDVRFERNSGKGWKGFGLDN